MGPLRKVETWFGSHIVQWVSVVTTGLLLVLPWTTWIRLHAPNVDVALYWTPTILFTLGIFAVLAFGMMWFDFYLGLFALYMTVRVLWTWTPEPIYTVWTIMLSCVAIVAVQRLSDTWRQWAILCLVVSAAMQILVGVWQALGYNPLWYGWQQIPVRRVYGTFGNSGQLGCLIALTFPFIPVWLAPWWMLGVTLSQSFTAAAVLGIVAILRWRKEWYLTVAGAGLFGLVLNAVRPFSTNTVPLRLTSWGAGWEWAIQRPITGYGPGSWAQMVPVIQNANPLKYTVETFQEAHNELLGLQFEGGLVAVLILALWVWDHQAWKSLPLIAAGIVSFWWFPFHFPAMLPVIVLIVGLSTPTIHTTETKETPCKMRRSGK